MFNKKNILIYCVEEPLIYKGIKRQIYLFKTLKRKRGA